MLAVKLQVMDRLWPVKENIDHVSYQLVGLHLRVGDVCVFELSMTDDVVFKVHIFRFVD